MERPVHTFIGEIAAIYLEEDCLTEGIPDVSKIDPVFFAPEMSQGKYLGCYWKLGDYVARAWEVGKNLR